MTKIPEWSRFESFVQRELGLSSTPGSGNQWNAPSDGRTIAHISENSFPLMVDSKFTTLKSYSITKKFLSQWVNKAALFGCRFAMPLRFSSEGTVEDYIVVRLSDFSELYQNFLENESKK